MAAIIRSGGLDLSGPIRVAGKQIALRELIASTSVVACSEKESY
jgi:hypothetical protein